MQSPADGAGDLQPGEVPRLHRVERVVRVLEDLRRGNSGIDELSDERHKIRDMYDNGNYLYQVRERECRRIDIFRNLKCDGEPKEQRYIAILNDIQIFNRGLS